MYKFRKNVQGVIVSAMMAAFLVMSLGATSVAAEGFSDVDSEKEFFTAIEFLEDLGTVVGFQDGSFGIDRDITRAEFSKIVLLHSDIVSEGSDCFEDVKGHWGESFVCALYDKDLVDGYADGLFHPERKINFAEASKIITNALGIKLSEENDEWFQPYVVGLEDIRGIPNTITSFDEDLSRGEMAEMIWRVVTDASYHIYTTFDNIQQGVLADDAGRPLEEFRTCTALKQYFTEHAGYGYAGVSYLEEADVQAVPIADSSDDSVARSVESESKAAAPGGADDGDFSTTNVQVEGVDEADIVKTDGTYIYIVKGDTVRIVKADLPSQMREVDAVTFGDTGFRPTDMYVDGDRLVVLGTSWGAVYPVEDLNFIGYYPYSSGTTEVYVIDISDPEDVEVMRELSFEGSLTSSRKVGDMVYVVMNRYYYYPELDEVEGGDLIPSYYDSAADKSESIVGCDDVLFPPGTEDLDYIVIAGIPVDTADAEVQKEVVVGSSSSIYSSRDNLYVTQPKYDWWYRSDDDMGEETVIHKFALDADDIDYQGKGAVPGHILNQFSMDESGGNFRIATTKGSLFDAENPSTSNVYVLNEGLDLIGSVEGIAPGEQIYSTRFLGNRLYMVTFKKVDPFFVIDMTEPTAPKILGKLKIPGFSDYLHPLDENHIIGVGKDAVEASEEETGTRSLDFAWYQGMKLAIFDVTDVENPTELHKVEIGDRGTSSELLYNHKALLFDAERGFMAFPVTLAELSQELKDDPETPSYTSGDIVYQGAYIYDVSVEDGFELRGRITHYDETEIAEKSGYYWYGEKDIDRILYIKDFFYTVSQGMVKANALDDLAEAGSVVVNGVTSGGYGYL